MNFDKTIVDGNIIVNLEDLASEDID